MRKNLITAACIAAALALWFLSGVIFGESAPTSHDTLAEMKNVNGAVNAGRITPVRARFIDAQPRTRFLVIRGKTQSKRSVEVKAETSGRVVERPVERGTRVKKGDTLCQLKVNEKEIGVVEMQAAVVEAEIEYAGSVKLKKQGLQSQTAIAQAETKLAAAKTNLRRARILLEATKIFAPFDGVVEKLHMDIGDYATVGSICATVINLDPMLVVADVTENEVEYLQLGNPVIGKTSVGQDFTGKITFLGSQSDLLTRTYPVEVTVANPGYRLRSGLTSTVRVALGEVMAQRVSPALFTLSDSGQLGVRVIDNNNMVEFFAVAVLEDTPAGVWVTGLPERAQLITVGQELVLAGQVVKPINTDAETDAAASFGSGGGISDADDGQPGPQQ